MKIYPKITIVTPSFNQGKYLEHTIRSVIDQGYPNLEYIIIDGGSTDNSVDIIKKYEQHLAYWVSEKDKGLYHGIQKGFERSTGDIMAWLNSDDMYHKKSLFAVAEIFENFSGVNWLMGTNTFYDEEGKVFVFDTEAYDEHWSKWRFFLHKTKKVFIQQESVFWRRSLWEKSGGYLSEELALAGDADLWLRFFRHEKLYTTTLMLAGFRFRNENQKSKDNINEYMAELNCLVQRELKMAKGQLYLNFIIVIKFLSKLIPFQKVRKKIIFKLLKFTPKLTYNPMGVGYGFGKKYNRSC